MKTKMTEELRISLLPLFLSLTVSVLATLGLEGIRNAVIGGEDKKKFEASKGLRIIAVSMLLVLVSVIETAFLGMGVGGVIFWFGWVGGAVGIAILYHEMHE